MAARIPPMRFVDRSQWPEQPTGGEILLQPKDATQHSAAVALCTLALERGPDGFVGGCTGQIPTSITLQAIPTLDDLAAAYVLVGESGRAASQQRSLRALGEYTALLRQGIFPGNVGPVRSLAALFLALINSSGDLGAPENAQKFVDQVFRVLEHVVQQLDQGKNLLSDDLFSDFAPCGRELAYLDADQKVYVDDLAAAQRWTAVLQGRDVDCLVLREPRSSLFKLWARRDTTSPSRLGYAILVVELTPGNWVCSVDPVRRLPFKAVAIQAALDLTKQENESRQRRGLEIFAEDPWYDGERFDWTLFASPRHKTVLEPPAVLAVVQRALHARPSRTSTHNRPRALELAAAGLAVAVVLGGFFFYRQGSRLDAAGPAAEIQAPFIRRGSTLGAEEIKRVRTSLQERPQLALLIAVTQYQDQPLRAPLQDVAAIRDLLTNRFGYRSEHVFVLADAPGAQDRAGAPSLEGIKNALWQIGQISEHFEESTFLLYYAGHGEMRKLPGKVSGYLRLPAPHADDLASTGVAPAAMAPDLRDYDMGQLARDVAKYIRSQHQLLLVDSCFSGFTITTRGDPRWDGRVHSLWRERARVVITAATTEQTAVEVADHSIFGRAFVEALGGGTQRDAVAAARGRLKADRDGDAIVTDEELAAYLAQRVPELWLEVVPGASSAGQTPLYDRDQDGDAGGQFLFIDSN